MTTKCFIAYQSGTTWTRACVGSYIGRPTAFYVATSLIDRYNTPEDALECAARGARNSIDAPPYTSPHVDVTGGDREFLMRYAGAVGCEHFYIWMQGEWYIYRMTSEGWGVRESLADYVANQRS